MLKEKQIQLKERLTKIIDEIGRNAYADDMRQEVINEFKSRNLNAVRASFAMTQNLDLNTLNESDDEDIRFLFMLTYAIDKAFEDRENIKINVEDYFTKLEVEQWTDYKEEEDKIEELYPLVFEKFQHITGNKMLWQGKMSAQKLSELRDNNLLIYNFKTQRNPKITAFGERINMDINKITEIKERMLNGDQYPDPIILNILNNGESKYHYNEKTETLTVYEGSIINIVDGFHRATASSMALEANPNLQFEWQITLTLLSEKDAHDYMTQKDKQKPIKKEYVQQMDYSKPENLVVDVIVDDRLSELAKVTKDDDGYIRLNRALTKKSIIADAIADNYSDQIETSIGVRNVGKWVVEFTDQLMGLYIEEFITNPYEVKEVSLINHKNMFYGYIALSAELQNNPDWKSHLKKVMESIDFNVSSPLWKGIGIIGNRDANKSTKGKIYRLFKEAISNV